MPTVILKLFAGQGTGRTDGQSGDYMLPPLGSIIIFYLKFALKINKPIQYCTFLKSWSQIF